MRSHQTKPLYNDRLIIKDEAVHGNDTKYEIQRFEYLTKIISVRMQRATIILHHTPSQNQKNRVDA